MWFVQHVCDLCVMYCVVLQVLLMVCVFVRLFESESVVYLRCVVWCCTVCVCCLMLVCGLSKRVCVVVCGLLRDVVRFVVCVVL